MKRSTPTQKTGTREWSELSVNCLMGCSHDCRYCYARERAVRFGNIKSPADWRVPRVREAEVRRRRRAIRGTVMFPTTHDLLPEFLAECRHVAGELGHAADRVLLVTKAHFEVLDDLTEHLRPHRSHVEWRITLGAIAGDVLEYWEPGAPAREERLAALRLAYGRGFRTSVSIEPLLEASRVDDLIASVEPWVTGTIWIGTMREIKRRVIPGTDPAAIAEIEAGQTPEMIRAIYERWKGHPNLRWKDSYRAVIERTPCLPS